MCVYDFPFRYLKSKPSPLFPFRHISHFFQIHNDPSLQTVLIPGSLSHFWLILIWNYYYTTIYNNIVHTDFQFQRLLMCSTFDDEWFSVFQIFIIRNPFRFKLAPRNWSIMLIFWFRLIRSTHKLWNNEWTQHTENDAKKRELSKWGWVLSQRKNSKLIEYNLIVNEKRNQRE